MSSRFAGHQMHLVRRPISYYRFVVYFNVWTTSLLQMLEYLSHESMLHWLNIHQGQWFTNFRYLPTFVQFWELSFSLILFVDVTSSNSLRVDLLKCYLPVFRSSQVTKSFSQSTSRRHILLWKLENWKCHCLSLETPCSSHSRTCHFGHSTSKRCTLGGIYGPSNIARWSTISCISNKMGVEWHVLCLRLLSKSDTVISRARHWNFVK